jgi:IclR family acetate operon transcriptional repressor
MKLDPTSSVKSADRAFDILEYVADAAEPPSFSQMLVDLRIPRSSLFHLLNNLLGRGYLEQDSVTDRYRVGDHVRLLAKKISGPPLATLVAPFLKQLTSELNETAGFYIRDGNTVEAIASTTSSQALAYTMKVGERAPLYAVSSGKITLSRMSSGELDAYLRDLTFEAVTPHTIASKRRLREDLAVVRQSGFGHSREEFTPGITGMATAVEHNGRLFGVLNLAVPTVRFSDEREAVFRRQLTTVAAALGQMLASRT